MEENNDKSSTFKLFLELLYNLFIEKLPFLSVIAILIGYINLDLYYSQFNIEIINFMSFSDALIVITKYCFYIIFLFIIWYTIVIMGEMFWYPLLVYFKVKKNNIHFKRMRKKNLLTFLFFGGMYIILSLGIIKTQIFIEDRMFYLVTFLILGCLSLLSIKISVVETYLNKEMIKYEDIVSDRIVYEHFNFVRSFWGLSIAIIFLIGYASSIKAEKMKKYPEQRVTLVELEDKTVNPIGPLYYIGKTESFVFFYNSLDSSSSAIKIDRVKLIGNFKRGYIQYLNDSLEKLTRNNNTSLKAK